MHLFAAVAVTILAQGYPPEPLEYDTTIDARVRAWFVDLSGETKLTDDGIGGSTVEFDDELDIDGPVPCGSATVRARLSHDLFLYVDYWQGGFEGEDVLTDAFFYGGSLYPPGTTVETTLTMAVATVNITLPFKLYHDDDTDIDVEFGGGAKYLYYKAKIDAKDTPIPFHEKTRLGVPVPCVTGLIRGRFGDWFSAEARVNGFWLANLRNTDASMFEAGVELKGYIYRGLYATAGYHVFLVDAGHDSGSEDLKVEAFAMGFEIGLGYEF